MRWLEFELFHSVVWWFIFSYSAVYTFQWNEIQLNYEEVGGTIRLVPQLYRGDVRKFFSSEC